MRYVPDMHRIATLPVGAYPNLSQLSAILRVPKSTLADRKVAFEHVGRRSGSRPVRYWNLRPTSTSGPYKMLRPTSWRTLDGQRTPRQLATLRTRSLRRYEPSSRRLPHQ